MLHSLFTFSLLFGSSLFSLPLLFGSIIFFLMLLFDSTVFSHTPFSSALVKR